MELKISMMGMNRGILKPQAVASIPADKAIRHRNSKGTIKVNPPRRDCIAWQDKAGNWIFKEEYEKSKYNKYLATVKDKEEPIGLDEFITKLWK